jgi:hypothetical protein
MTCEFPGCLPNTPCDRCVRILIWKSRQFEAMKQKVAQWNPTHGVHQLEKILADHGAPTGSQQWLGAANHIKESER